MALNSSSEPILKVVSIDGAPHGPIALTTECLRSLFDIVLPQAEKENTPQHDTMRYLENLTKAFCQQHHQ